MLNLLSIIGPSRNHLSSFPGCLRFSNFKFKPTGYIDEIMIDKAIEHAITWSRKMRAVLQRVKSASVRIQERTTGRIDKGIAVLLGIHTSDTTKELRWMADKIINLRIFEDENGKMNRSLADIGGEVLIVSQFTLYGDCRKGRRPGYSTAAPPHVAEPLYLQFVEEMKNRQLNVATGTFQAEMEVELINDGPVTLLLDSDKAF